MHVYIKEPFTGERFPGYENINHDLHALAAIFRMGRPDWKATLENVKGVYVIFDGFNGKKYVGSAYGEFGIWSRWSVYMGTGHGCNDELVKVIEAQRVEYAMNNSKPTRLEYRLARTDDNVIIARENYWKNALLSRGEYGYNNN